MQTAADSSSTRKNPDSTPTSNAICADAGPSEGQQQKDNDNLRVAIARCPHFLLSPPTPPKRGSDTSMTYVTKLNHGRTLYGARQPDKGRTAHPRSRPACRRSNASPSLEVHEFSRRWGASVVCVPVPFANRGWPPASYELFDGSSGVRHGLRLGCQ